jgi:predicted nuclease of predicted toxin-antitoxin system
MKILLDENIDVRFKHLFDNSIHQVFTVRDMAWRGIKNGELFKLLKTNKFDVLIAIDKNIPNQQNQNSLPVLVIILDVKRNVLSRIIKLYPTIERLITRPVQKEIIVLDE